MPHAVLTVAVEPCKDVCQRLARCIQQYEAVQKASNRDGCDGIRYSISAQISGDLPELSFNIFQTKSGSRFPTCLHQPDRLQLEVQQRDRNPAGGYVVTEQTHCFFTASSLHGRRTYCASPRAVWRSMP